MPSFAREIFSPREDFPRGGPSIAYIIRFTIRRHHPSPPAVAETALQTQSFTYHAFLLNAAFGRFYFSIWRKFAILCGGLDNTTADNLLFRVTYSSTSTYASFVYLFVFSSFIIPLLFSLSGRFRTRVFIQLLQNRKNRFGNSIRGFREWHCRRRTSNTQRLADAISIITIPRAKKKPKNFLRYWRGRVAKVWLSLSFYVSGFFNVLFYYFIMYTQTIDTLGRAIIGHLTGFGTLDQRPTTEDSRRIEFHSVGVDTRVAHVRRHIRLFV